LKRVLELWRTAVHHLTIPGLLLTILGLGLMAAGLVYHLHTVGMAAPVPGFEDWFTGYVQVADTIMSAGFLLFVIGALIGIARLLKVTLGSTTSGQ